MRSLILTIFMVLPMFSCSVSKLVLSPENSKRGDAVFSLLVPDNNYAKLHDIHIYSWTQGGELNVNRVLVDFNLERIPARATIDSAFLNLYFNPVSAYNKVGGNKGNQGDDSIMIRRVTSEWNEKTVTWNRQPETTAENQLILGKKKDAQASYAHLDITRLVQDMVNSETGQYGIMIRHKEEVPYNVVFFASGDHPDKRLHPKLEVYYRKK